MALVRRTVADPDVGMEDQEERPSGPSQTTLLQHFDRKVKKRVPKGSAGEQTLKAPARATRAATALGSSAAKAGAKEAAEDSHDAESGAGTARQDTPCLDDAALLLQFLSSANGASSEFTKQAEEVKEEAHDEFVVGAIDHWAWEPSCHEGLLTYHDGRKRWYHCTNCQYFNDRLYHSKMHYDRIHIKQGKSMPRKRKYIEPAGSKAGEGVALPPSTLQQPELARTRTRRPGDKWLKTSATGGSASGCGYVSVYERNLNTTCPTLTFEMALKQKQGVHIQTNQPPADVDAPSPTEIRRLAKAKGLDEAETLMWCWETEKSVKLGYDSGAEFKKFTPIHIFGGDVTAESAHRPTEQQHDTSALMHAQKEKKGLRWWWCNPRKGEVSDADGDKDENTASCWDEDVAEHLSQQPTQTNTPEKLQPKVETPSGRPRAHAPLLRAEIQCSSLAAPPPAPPVAAAQQRVVLSPSADHVKVKREDGENDGHLHGVAHHHHHHHHLPGVVAGGAGGGGKGAGSGKSMRRAADMEAKMKRVWRRWDAEEERLLRYAVQKLGTKDWSAIHAEMATDRSIKQLQDHWNDTKNTRGSKS